MSDTLRAAIRTFFQALLALFVVFVTGLFNWLADKLGTSLPTYSVGIKAVLSALLAVIIGFVTAAFIWVQNKLKVGVTPEYTPAGVNVVPPDQK